MTATQSTVVLLSSALLACSPSTSTEPEPDRTAQSASADERGPAPAPPQAPRPPQPPQPSDSAAGSERPATSEATLPEDPKERTSGTADAPVLEDFERRIDAYMKLRGRIDGGRARIKETSDPAKITAAQDELAARIRAERKDAKAGDIFTPEIRDLFRRLISPEMKGPDAAETRTTIKDDAPAANVPLKVNAPYPEGQPVPTVPPNVLARLPQLPEHLEYRIVGKSLILRDADANLIIDFIPGAIR